jgi:hypothetical protein
MEHTITLSKETYRALQNRAACSQKTVEALVEEWIQERLELEQPPEARPIQYAERTDKPSALREAGEADQETITVELPSEVYDGLRVLGAKQRIDPVQVLADLVKRAQVLWVPDSAAVEDPAPKEPGLLEQIASLAQDLGVEDLSEQHDHYLYGTEKR